MKKVGLIVGREWSFPPRFIEEVNGAERGRRRGVRQARRHAHGRADARTPCSSTASRTRCRTTAATSSTPCSRASRSSTTRSCGPPTTSSSARRWPTKLGVAHPKTRGAAEQGLRPRHRARRRACATSTTRSTGRRSSITSACRASSRTPTAAAGAACTSATSLEELIRYYDGSGLLTMIAQEFIEWDQYVRCMCLGQRRRAADALRPDATAGTSPTTNYLEPAAAAARHRRLAEAGEARWATT